MSDQGNHTGLRGVLPGLVVAALVGLLILSSLRAAHLPPLRVYLEAAHGLAKGEVIGSDDVRVVMKRLAGEKQPITSPEDAIGLMAGAEVMSGTPLFAADLRRPPEHAGSDPTAMPGSSPPAPCCCCSPAAMPPRDGNGGDGNGDGGGASDGNDRGDDDGALKQEIVDEVTLALRLELQTLRGELSEQEATTRDAILEEFSIFRAAQEDIIGLIEIQQKLGAGRSGGATLTDVLHTALEIGQEVMASEGGGGTLDRFLDEFAPAFGRELGGDLGESVVPAVKELGRFIYDQLSSSPEPPPLPPVGARVSQMITITYSLVGAVDDPAVGAALDDVAAPWDSLISGSGCSLLVAGHTDTVGTDAANMALSERRAAAVAELVQARFRTAPVKTEAWGERRLTVWTADGVSEAANRRVDVTLTCGPSGTD